MMSYVALGFLVSLVALNSHVVFLLESHKWPFVFGFLFILLNNKYSDG